MPNIFDDISVEKAPLDSGANSVNMAKEAPTVTKYKPDVAAQGDFMFRNLSGKEVFTGTEEDYHSLAKYGAEPNASAISSNKSSVSPVASNIFVFKSACEN